MKYSREFPFDKALPDAPLAMPKQLLERRNSFFSVLRQTLWSFTGL